LTPARVQQLKQLGFHCTTPATRVNAWRIRHPTTNTTTSTTTANNNTGNTDDTVRMMMRMKNIGNDDDDDDDTAFAQMLVELKRLKQVHAPIKTNRQLEWWIAEQRKQYALFKANQPTSTMTPTRIAMMVDAGFPFEKAKTPTWDERAVEWLEFKTKMGRDPMRDEALYQWVYKQRVKYKQQRQQQQQQGEGGKRNNLTEEQIKYGTVVVVVLVVGDIVVLRVCVLGRR
jgi:hypothetical protein